jgi:ankyrin repeat protein
MAHISVTLGYLQLLRHLFTWEIDLNVVDHMRLTALHYAYLFKQEECAKFLIHSGVDQFILDDLGRSPSDLDPSLEVRLHPIMDIDSGSHAEGPSPIEHDTEMLDEAGRLHAKHFLVRQWMLHGEDEKRGDVPPPRCQHQEPLGPPRSAGSPPALNSADERDWGVT